jgi:hypothetical protein
MGSRIAPQLRSTSRTSSRPYARSSRDPAAPAGPQGRERGNDLNLLAPRGRLSSISRGKILCVPKGLGRVSCSCSRERITDVGRCPEQMDRPFRRGQNPASCRAIQSAATHGCRRNPLPSRAKWKAGIGIRQRHFNRLKRQSPTQACCGTSARHHAP